MQSRSVIVLTVFVLAGIFYAGTAVTQTPSLRRDLSLQSDIQQQRISRQTEIIRLETTVDRLEDRVARLERLQLGSSRLPMISNQEAQAAVRLAEARLAETKHQFEAGKAKASHVAADELELVRAAEQLKLAKAAATEGYAMLKLDFAIAQGRIAELRRQLKLSERLVARGLSNSDSQGLTQKLLDVEKATQELNVLKARLSVAKQNVQ